MSNIIPILIVCVFILAAVVMICHTTVVCVHYKYRDKTVKVEELPEIDYDKQNEVPTIDDIVQVLNEELYG